LINLNSIKIYTKQTQLLRPSERKSIYILKNTEWDFGVKEQYNWFQKEIKKRDIHILLKKNNNLIGYTCLRYKKFFFEKKNNTFLLLDTHIIKKNFRNKGYGKILVNKAVRVIKKKKILSLLFCKKNQLKYYKKFHWNVINKKKYFSNKKHKKLHLMFLGKNICFKKKFII
jgi:predicted GNAT family N-acyltransferase